MQGRSGSGRVWPWLGGMLGATLLGPAIQLQQACLWPLTAWLGCTAAALALAALAFHARRHGRARGAAAWLLLAIALGSFAATGLRALHRLDNAFPAALQGRDLVVTGVIAGLPQDSAQGQRFLFAVESAQVADVTVQVPDRLVLGWYAYASRRTGAHDAVPTPPLRAGDRWRFTVRVKAPHGQLNPHGFDQELSYWEQNVAAIGYVRTGASSSAPRRIGSSGRFALQRIRQRVRDAVFERIADPGRAGVVAALTLGDQGAIERSDWEVFRATGVAHLVSISGLHITLFAWLACVVIGWGWRRSERLCLLYPAQHAALAGGLLLAASYAAFSGWGVPAQRTIWMLASITVLRLSGLHWPWPMVWLLAAAVVVTIDPWALLQPGFWLSFVAVGVLFAAQRPQGSRLSVMLREQMVVTVALAPLTLLLFGQLSLVGLPANLLAIPWVTLVLTPLGLAGIVLPPLWDAAGWAVAALNAWLRLLAQLPWAVWTIAAPPPLLALAALCGGVLLSLRLPRELRLLGLPLLLPVLLWQSPRPAVGAFELLAVDVGQGSAVIVRTAGHSLLYDAGPRWGPDSEAGSRILVPLLRALGERLDVVVVSHRDSDHIGGAAAVLRAHPGAQLWSSIEQGHELAAVRTPRTCLAGQRWSWDGVAFEFVHPSPQDYASPRSRPNARSCVLRVSAGGRAALLAGDIERAQERRLTSQPSPRLEGAAKPVDLRAVDLRADLLLVPHHGSRTSSSAAFLDAVQPKLAVVQAGWRNRFGHPARDVLARYQERGIELISTVSCGAARWQSSEPRRVTCERQAQRRYWHHDPTQP